MLRRVPWLVSVLSLFAACSSGNGSTGDAGTTRDASTSDAKPTDGGSSGTESGTDGAAGSCLGSTLLAALGKDRLIVGLTGSDAAAASAPFDLRYVYLSGGLFTNTTPCTTCGTSCGTTWWGCYNTPPGAYATDFIMSAQKASPAQVPMFTYYEILADGRRHDQRLPRGDRRGHGRGDEHGIMTRYYNDWRFLLHTIGTTKAMLHIEPDFWGYVRQAGDPTTLAAVVGAVNRPTAPRSRRRSPAWVSA
jgi:hypothetical protein